MKFNLCLLSGILVLLCHLSYAQKSSIKKVNRGRFEEAEDLSKQALLDLRDDDAVRAATKEAYMPHDYVKRITPYHVLGLVQKFKGNYTEAERNFQKADSIYFLFKDAMRERLNTKKWMPTTRYSTIGAAIMNSKQANRHFVRRAEIARMYLKFGELEASRKVLDEMMIELRATYEKNTSLTKSAYAVYGEYFQTTLDFDSSRYYFDKYIIELYSDPSNVDTSIKRIGDAHNGLAEAYINLQEYDSALMAAKKGYKLEKHRFVRATDGKNYLGKIASANLVAESYRLKNDYDKALTWNDKAFNLFNKHIKVVSPEKLPVLAVRGQIFWALSDTVNAHKTFQELMDVFSQYTQHNFSYLSEPERAYFYRTNKHFVELAKGYYHHLYFQQGVKQNYVVEALYEIQLNNKGVLLNSSSKLLNEIYAKGDTNLIQAYQQIRALREKKMQHLQKGEHSELLSLDQEITAKEKQIRSKLSIESDKYVSATEIMTAIPEKTHLVDIAKVKVFALQTDNNQTSLTETKESKYVFFVFEPGKPIELVQSNLTDQQLEGRYYQAYLNFARNNLQNDQVYHAYFDPFENKLHHKKIIFSGDGIYNLINPEILFNGKEYLIGQYQFFSVVSAKDLVKHTSPRENAITDVTLVGFPDYDTHLSLYGEKPLDLPGTQTEIQGIEKQLPNSVDRHIYLQGAASESIVKQIASSSVLHFATHGFFHTEKLKDPMHTTGLVLAVGQAQTTVNDDGFLTAYEASNLDLKQTYLVVLSACETGQGAFEEGEGVWGLQRAFQVAGVRYLVMSLFKVDDEVTSLLMQQFYANMIAGKPVIEAFHEAQLIVKSKYESPVQWGAFVIKGI
ncbi:CHAT domain-containing protein [Pseudochryseolinea flava]|uniref:CHAT domain-containing protein n=1 Tax=Pseudochryseolinea flava TaxID=2059302 RepID=A0A364XX23_9BACT|nr:CHAT domain-containing tetratricopeptide repeat protein [Pseudochryseolinea flava]RAV98523.1 hypothetical protein DQQ10_23680 [Pseudochryseolinea flava]